MEDNKWEMRAKIIYIFFSSKIKKKKLMRMEDENNLKKNLKQNERKNKKYFNKSFYFLLYLILYFIIYWHVVLYKKIKYLV